MEDTTNFLQTIEDAANWVEHKAEGMIEAVEEALGVTEPAGAELVPVATEQPQVEGDAVEQTQLEAAAPAIEVPAEAAAIAADPAAPGAVFALNQAAGE
jgi:hypothetical protein